jgi:hypothetical protein
LSCGWLGRLLQVWLRFACRFGRWLLTGFGDRVGDVVDGVGDWIGVGVPLLRVCRCGGIPGEPTKAGVAVSPVNQRCRSLAVVASVTSVTVSTPAKCTPLGVAVESVVGWALGVVWVCRCGGIPGEPTKAGVAVSPVNQRCRSLAVVASVTSVTVSTPAKCTPLGVAVKSVTESVAAAGAHWFWGPSR